MAEYPLDPSTVFMGGLLAAVAVIGDYLNSAMLNSTEASKSESFKSRLASFGFALGTYWLELMGSAFFTFLGWYVAATGKSNNWVVAATFFVALLLFLFAAFRVWNDEHTKQMDSSAQVKKYEERSTKLLFISNRFSHAYYLSITAPLEGATLDDIEKWKKDADEWVRTTYDLLFSFSPVAATKFHEIHDSKSELDSGVAVEVVGLVGILNKRIKNLTEIIEKADTYLACVN